MSAITTHVLDTALGKPGAGVPVRLEFIKDGEPVLLARAVTDADGRVGDFGPDELETGRYRLVFDVAAYAAGTGQDCFFPEAVITFTPNGPAGSHFHIPLLLSPFAYSTYRGS
ncbi:hydroxyisourate hydrolase [Nocardia goodfellowii]|uniref:5-hydroxyisourate hydrolase n=1 Tax=Nocardia goodfellowii TaxID=882446 RepID=A0ABS4QQE4_9NOCA|nr:hydroxyisourate hydrolase [Nocardia goodfellowii]MBP2192866.1 5-hydroxyisourate hydrolase [Nocardia goodfellowii]